MSETNFIGRLRHMRDLGPDEAEASRAIAASLAGALAKGGFQRLDTPVLERTDMFIRKSGGEIAGSLYAFSDPGGVSVSLRPEFTPSVIRWFIENVRQPCGSYRYRYSGPVFRYGGSRGARFRQFHQVGGELIGTPGSAGDVEILRAALDCLESIGVSGCRLRLGHLGVVRALVSSQNLSKPLQMFVISNLEDIGGRADCLARLGEKAAAAGLVIENSKDAVYAQPIADSSVPALDALGHSISGPTGRRTSEQILTRLFRRMGQASSRADFSAAIENVARLVSATGSACEVAAHARTVFEKCGAPLDRVEELESTLSNLRRAGVDESAIQLDLSFVRGLAYYTGIVFEFTDGEGASEHPLGGGGRYDDLVRAFGGADVPACGFALNVDELAALPPAPKVDDD